MAKIRCLLHEIPPPTMQDGQLHPLNIRKECSFRKACLSSNGGRISEDHKNCTFFKKFNERESEIRKKGKTIKNNKKY